jgi:hypothetical protein
MSPILRAAAAFVQNLFRSELWKFRDTDGELKEADCLRQRYQSGSASDA